MMLYFINLFVDFTVSKMKISNEFQKIFCNPTTFKVYDRFRYHVYLLIYDVFFS